MSEAVATDHREHATTRAKAHPLSDEMLSRMVDDPCVTASRADVDLSLLLDVLPGLAKLGKGSAAALVRVVEHMQQTSTNVSIVTNCLEDRFPAIDEQDRQARARLNDLNTQTKRRLGTKKSI